MPKKGTVNNPKGRPAGSKNEKTRQWEELGHALITTHSERANKILAKMDDTDFMNHFERMLEYFQPKLQRTEANVNANVNAKVRAINWGDQIIDIQ